MHQGDLRAQEPNARDLTDEACPLEVCFKEWLMKPSDLLAPFEVCPVKPDEIAIFGEYRGEGLAAALVPAMHHLLIEGTHGDLISRLRGC